MKTTTKMKSVLLAACIATGMLGTGCEGDYSTGASTALSEGQAKERLDKIITKTTWTEDIVQRAKSIDLNASADLATTLPPITEYPLTVAPRGPGVIAEICASSEKAGKGDDGWLNETAQAFNAKGVTIEDGRAAKVAVRKVASGTCHEYIASGIYLPDGFSPSNVLWIRMVDARGTAMEPIAERLVGNTAGVVMKEAVADKIRTERGALGVKEIIEAIAAGEIAMGYTNPFASSTGLNFLQTTLATYAGGDESKMADPAVISAFETFQLGVPFVALTTIQMRDAVGDKGSDGPLDAFVMERQTFVKVKSFRSGWEFIPFGVRHDNPLYAVASAPESKKLVLKAFAEYALSKESQTLASRYGFNADADYTAPYETPQGATLRAAQRQWKEKKDSGKPIIGVFAVDVSGSMGGTAIRQVRQALTKGAEFISPTSAIGLVAFSESVSVRLPVRRFDIQHKARFLAAVEELEEGGGTAMYDAVAVSMRLLHEAKTGELASGKLRLLVLSDGATRSGHSLDDIAPVVKALKVPVYTIAYGEQSDTDELSALAGLAEAAALKANEEKVSYAIGSLLNAQL